ncbi:MAG: hypothetical protein QHC65_04250 [Sphingomonas sp.]|nr:hypothetical protein [Sphingomonas sp.]MDX3883610.1 hypothetical protein [Sphingomonas sp.]
MRHGGRALAPTAAGVAAFPAGAQAGGLAGALVGGPIGGLVGAGLGGLGAAFGAGALTEKAQGWLIDQMPLEWQRAIGQDAETRAADEFHHPYASFIGDVAPQLLFMRPGWMGGRAALGAGAIGAGVEAGQEYAETGAIDPFRVTAQGVLGAALGRNTRLGDAVQAPAHALVRIIPGGSGGTLAGEAARETIRAMPEGLPEAHRTPDEIAAHVVEESERVARSANPFGDSLAGSTAHAWRLAETTQAIAEGRRPDFSGLPPAPRPAADFSAAMKIIGRHESGNRYDAQSPNSTAYGRFQFIDSTWIKLAAQRGDPDALAALERGDSAARARVLAARRDPATQDLAMRQALAEYARAYRAAGIEPTNADLYLMHALGPKAAKILKAPRDTPIEVFTTARERAANGSWLKGTAGDVIAEFERRSGSAGKMRAPMVDDDPRYAADMMVIDADFARPEIGVELPALVQEVRAQITEAIDAGAPVRLTIDGETRDIVGPDLIDDQGRRWGVDGVMDRVAAGEARIEIARPAEPGEAVPRARPWGEVVAELRSAGGGEVKGALFHPETGPIDILWGNGKGGLAHIIAKHPDVVDALPDHLAQMQVVRETPNRIQLESADHHATIRLDYDGQARRWLLTAFRKDRAPAPAEDGRAGAPGRDGSPAFGADGDIASRTMTDKERGYFDDPAGEGVAAQVESVRHDLEMALEADPGMTVQIDADGPPVRVADLLRKMADDERAIGALRACLTGKGGEA